MTEQEWLTCDRPDKILDLLGPCLSSRKYRLLHCHWCRDNASEFPDDRNLTAVEAAERYADGRASDEEVRMAEEAARQAFERWEAEGNKKNASYADLARRSLVMDAEYFRYRWRMRRKWPIPFSPDPLERSRLRDVFGNPFRPVTVDPAWRTSTVLALAHGIYDEKAFDRLPILADALQDAGCSNDDVLDHFRGPGPHVRGCWALDLLVDKS